MRGAADRAARLAPCPAGAAVATSRLPQGHLTRLPASSSRTLSVLPQAPHWIRIGTTKHLVSPQGVCMRSTTKASLARRLIHCRGWSKRPTCSPGLRGWVLPLLKSEICRRRTIFAGEDFTSAVLDIRLRLRNRRPLLARVFALPSRHFAVSDRRPTDPCRRREPPESCALLGNQPAGRHIRPPRPNVESLCRPWNLTPTLPFPLFTPAGAMLYLARGPG